jgi:outer membrane protein
MLRRVILFSVFLLGINFVNGQYAYIDSDYILQNVPEYNEAKEKLDRLSENWTKQIEDRYKVVQDKRANFIREEVLLPKEEKDKRKEEIEKIEKDAIDLQTTYFGSNGMYFQKRQELIKPIQDRIYTAMKKVAKSEGYEFVFDKSNQSNLVYAIEDYDISESVLEEMGIIKE